MSTLQSLASDLLPQWLFSRIENSSRCWMIQCPTCQAEKSVWEAGGLRYGAASYGKRIAAQCSHCDRLVAAKLYYRSHAAVHSEEPTLQTPDASGV